MMSDADRKRADADCDAQWTYIGQSTWLLQIAPTRYLIRSTYSRMDSGASLSLICIDGPINLDADTSE
jgi:hypothetical protein